MSAGLLGIVYVIAAILWLPTWIVSQTLPPGVQPGDRLTAITNTRGALLGVLIPLAAAIAGTAAWIGLRVTQGQLEETRRQNERLFATSKRQLDLSLQDQVNDRFSRAIDQLGQGEQDVRIGGIYSLGQIARDSDELHWPVMEVLMAFIKERRRRHRRSSEDGETHGPSDQVPADIQAALTVIGRRHPELDEGYLNLEVTNLDGARLSAAELQGAGLWEVSLETARLDYANLQDAHLDGANLRKAVLVGANLQGASLKGANLQDAVLLQTNLRDAVLLGANLRGAVLVYQGEMAAKGLTSDQLALAGDVDPTQLPPYVTIVQPEPAETAADLPDGI